MPERNRNPDREKECLVAALYSGYTVFLWKKGM
jgi:hypothetical protein